MVSKAQTETLKFMCYNLMFYRASNPPCTHNQTPSQRAVWLKTIVDHVNPDIFVVNELGATPTNANNILTTVLNTDSVDRFHQANYSNNNFSNLTNMLFYDSTKVGLHSQTVVSKDLSNQDLVRVIDLYTMYHKDPGLALGADTTYFVVVAAHLKAGNTIPDEIERGEAAKALMSYLSSSVQHENVILCGDLNLYDNAEPAFQELTNYSVASERFIDPLGQVGNWHDNSSYASIHTQSTRSNSANCFSGGGMDDRFDFFLISDAVRRGDDNVKYNTSSYSAIGQDGGHFNQSINAGTNSSAPAAVISALYNLSDHLPLSMTADFTLSNIGLEENSLASKLFVANPVENLLRIRFNEAAGTELSVALMDMSGKKRLRTVELAGDAMQAELNVSDLPKGVYLLNIVGNGYLAYTKKIVKL